MDALFESSLKFAIKFGDLLEEVGTFVTPLYRCFP